MFPNIYKIFLYKHSRIDPSKKSFLQKQLHIVEAAPSSKATSVTKEVLHPNVTL